jgi:hypothetical protein
MSNEARIIQGLQQRGIPLHIAQGMVANMIAESRLDPSINEIAPLVKGSLGGFGLNQWTGPRRRALEAAAAARGVPVSNLDFQLDYTVQELQGPEGRAWKALQGARTAEEAARLYSEKFLRPGIPHLENRLAHARRIAGGGNPAQGGAGGANALAMAQGGRETDAPQNALAAAQERQQRNALAMLQRAQIQPIEAPQMDVQPAPVPMFAFAPAQQYQPDFTPRSVRRRT